jgi:TPR repeat protein
MCGAIKICLLFPVAALSLFAQPAQSAPWWRTCELDVRYRRAYDPDHSYGYISGLGGWKVDEVSAIAKSGDACMQYIRGRIYAYDGVVTNVDLDLIPRDFGLAAKWWRLAAEQGHRDAQVDLADLYRMGRGVRQDYVEAVKWYTKAAEQGIPCAQLSLGRMYRESQGVPKNYVQAHMWMNLAAAGGHEGEYCIDAAAEEREKLGAAMTPSQITEAQRRAREWTVKISPDPIPRRTYEK